jgi:hypothetical protein
LEKLRQNQSQTFSLGISAVEFYGGQCRDLLHPDKAAVLIGDDYALQGQTVLKWNTMSDFFPIIQTIVQKRTTLGTNFNPTASGGSGGSSRSHCAIVWTLLVKRDDKVRKATLTMLDLAGAERLGDAAATSCFEDLRNPHDLTVEQQARIINYELFEFGKEVLKAASAHKRRFPYRPPRQNASLFCKFVGSCLEGQTALHMMVCLSQAPPCGWCTWFSLQHGTDLAALRAPWKETEMEDHEKALKRAQRKLKETREALDKPTNQQKYVIKKQAMARQVETTLKMMMELK